MVRGRGGGRPHGGTEALARAGAAARGATAYVSYSTTTGTTTGGLKFDNSFDADFLFIMNSNGNDHYWDFLTLTATNTD